MWRKSLVSLALLALVRCGSGGTEVGGSHLTEITANPWTGFLVSDQSGKRLTHFTDFVGGTLTSYGSLGSGDHQFMQPNGLAADSFGRIYVVDSYRTHARLVRIDDLSGAGWTTLGSYGPKVNQFRAPQGLAIDSADRIYIADVANQRVVRINDISGAGWTELFLRWGVNGVAVDGSGRLLVTQSSSAIAQADDMSGTNLKILGKFGGGVHQFRRPQGITTDASGRIYIADKDNNRIVRIDDISGAGWTELGTFGPGVNQFAFPTDIKLDTEGKIYVVDGYNGRIVRMDDMSGAGWTTFTGTADGTVGWPGYLIARPAPKIAEPVPDPIDDPFVPTEPSE